MEIIRFVFWEAVKALALVLLGMVSAKAVAALAVGKRGVKPALYALILALAAMGAWEVGNDVAAEVSMWTAGSSLRHGNPVKAYESALQAVALRPGNLAYWRTLVQAKVALQQLQSVLDDQPALRALSHGELDEVDDYQFALCSYFLGHDDPVLATTQRLIRQNPSYAAPYVLEGLAYTAEQKYPEAQQSFLAVLQRFPNNQAAVEGLARACYLDGDRQRALEVLDETAKVPFSQPARQRFAALKGLYDQ